MRKLTLFFMLFMIVILVFAAGCGKSEQTKKLTSRPVAARPVGAAPSAAAPAPAEAPAAAPSEAPVETKSVEYKSGKRGKYIEKVLKTDAWNENCFSYPAGEYGKRISGKLVQGWLRGANRDNILSRRQKPCQSMFATSMRVKVTESCRRSMATKTTSSWFSYQQLFKASKSLTRRIPFLGQKKILRNFGIILISKIQ